MRIVSRNGHVQSVYDVDRRFAPAKDGVNKVVAKVTVRSAVPARRNTWRKGILLRPHAFAGRLFQPLFASSIADKTASASVVPIVSGVLAA